MKHIIKNVSLFIAGIILIPYLIIYRIEGLIIGKDRAFRGYSQFFSLIPGIIGQLLRAAFYKNTISHYGINTWIEFGTKLSYPDTWIGDNVSIGPNSMLGKVIIEDDSLISGNVNILSGRHQHDFSDINQPIKDQQVNIETVRIGQGFWLGNGSIIMANVGKGAIVGLEELLNY